MVYYIDSRYGSDSNDGLSRQTAFASVGKMSEITLKGGDTVLIKADTEYNGSLHLKLIATAPVQNRLLTERVSHLYYSKTSILSRLKILPSQIPTVK